MFGYLDNYYSFFDGGYNKFFEILTLFLIFVYIEFGSDYFRDFNTLLRFIVANFFYYFFLVVI